MSKDLAKRQSSAVEKVQGKHHVFPRTRSGWIATSATGLVSFIVCAASHFDGGTVLGGLFLSFGVSTFSDDTIHALLYGRRLPEHMAMSNSNGKQFKETAADLACRWLGWERNPNPRRDESFKSIAARWLGMPVYENDDPNGQPKSEPFYNVVEEKQEGSDRMVDLAPALQLDIDDIAGKAIFICGIRRSGKTTLGVRIAEELGKFNIPMLIPCIKGDWLSVATELPNARIWGQEQIGMKHARAVGWGILEKGMQLIFNIASYDDVNEAFDILAEIILGLFEWEKAHPDDKRLCAIFKDEAQTVLPQNLSRSIITIPAVRDKVLGVYSRVIAFGGSYGLFPIIMTQRIAEVNKVIIGQPELLFLFKQTLDIDLQRYQEFTDIPTEQVRGLKQGHGIYVSYEGQSSIHKFHKRTSDDSMSSTPRYKETPVSSPSSKSSPSPKTHRFSESELENLGHGESENEGEKVVKQPLEPRESGASFTSKGENGERLGETFTTEQEQQIILAALAIAQSGAKVTRGAIKDRLGWNNKQYDVLKAVCDKHNIA